MIQANRWSPTGHPHSTLQGRQLTWPGGQNPVGRFLVGLSTHLGFLPSPGAGHKGVCLLGGAYGWHLHTIG